MTEFDFAEEAQADGFEEFRDAACGVAFGEEDDWIEVIGRSGMVDDTGGVGHELVVANAAGGHVGAGTAEPPAPPMAKQCLARLKIAARP